MIEKIQDMMLAYNYEHNREPSYLIIDRATYDAMFQGTTHTAGRDIPDITTILGLTVCIPVADMPILDVA